MQGPCHVGGGGSLSYSDDLTCLHSMKRAARRSFDSSPAAKRAQRAEQPLPEGGRRLIDDKDALALVEDAAAANQAKTKGFLRSRNLTHEEWAELEVQLVEVIRDQDEGVFLSSEMLLAAMPTLVNLEDDSKASLIAIYERHMRYEEAARRTLATAEALAPPLRLRPRRRRLARRRPRHCLPATQSSPPPSGGAREARGGSAPRARRSPGGAKGSAGVAQREGGGVAGGCRSVLHARVRLARLTEIDRDRRSSLAARPRSKRPRRRRPTRRSALARLRRSPRRRGRRLASSARRQRRSRRR